MSSVLKKRAPKTQRGMSLVEVAVAMAIMGVAATVSWQSIQGNWTRQDQAASRVHMERAEAAVLTFLAIHGRMPCPAALSNGIETCDGRLEGRFPFRTAGVPEIKAATLDYRLHVTVAPHHPRPVLAPQPDAEAPPEIDRWFHVLMNDQPISQSTSPRVFARPLREIALPTYDGLLDRCEALSHLSRIRASAFSLQQGKDSAGHEGMRSSRPIVRKVSAAQVSEALSCAPLVTVNGRAPYNAHLAAVTMNKTLKDYKWIFEADYGTYVADLVEGMFFTGTRLWGQARSWPKTLQVMSKANSAETPKSNPVDWRNLALSVANQAATLASLGAQMSNVVRFSINLNAAKGRYKVVKDLEHRGKEIDALAWQHAIMLSSSSAYFLREQQEAPPPPTAPDLVAIEGPSMHATDMLEAARNRAMGAGLLPLLGSLSSFPSYTAADRGVSINLAADPGPSGI